MSEDPIGSSNYLCNWTYVTISSTSLTDERTDNTRRNAALYTYVHCTSRGKNYRPTVRLNGNNITDKYADVAKNQMAKLWHLTWSKVSVRWSAVSSVIGGCVSHWWGRLWHIMTRNSQPIWQKWNPDLHTGGAYQSLDVKPLNFGCLTAAGLSTLSYFSRIWKFRM